MKTTFSYKLIDFLASGFYSGYAPFASGTFGSLVAAGIFLVYYLICGAGPDQALTIVLSIFTFVLGVICCKMAIEKNIYPDNDDPSQIVIDEFAGFFTTMIFIQTSILSIIIGFFCFRFFDILKPPPVRQADSIKGAWGIMLDDILAGIYAGLVAAIILFYLQPLTASAQEEIYKEEFNINFNPVTNGKLAFSYEKGSEADLYYIDFSKQTVLPLVTGNNKQIRPSWSPNGQQLAYVENSGEANQVIILDLKSGNKTSYGSNESLNFASWSPDGKKLTSSSKTNIFIVDIASGKINTLITPSKGKKFSTPAWSPRGNEIIYVTSEFWPGLDLEIYDLKAKKSSSLSTGYQDFFSPSWHPSGGSFLALYGAKENVDIWDFHRGAEFPEILFQRDGQELDPVWSEDGELVFFAGETPAQSNKFQIFVWIKSQGKIHQITQAKGSTLNLSWTPITEE